ncbi:MAG: HAD hydrolase family protein [Planctomycetes bacterium]|nr:HAD hydrolase family protein [Planctomycetota bacterium]MCP4839076.1 HAD hydrolase family protein [Planctomycetota bacterium]
MGRPDLLVIDLDGTLLDRTGLVSPENIAGIRRAESESLPLVIATGRTRSESAHILEAIAYEGLLISASGSLLVDSHDGHTLDRRTLSPEIVEQTVAFVLAGGAAAMILKDRHSVGVDYVVVGTGNLHPVSDWWFEVTGATYTRVDRIEADPFPEHSVRVGAVGGTTEFIPMIAELERMLGSLIQARHWEAVTSSEHAGEPVHLLEVFHPEADKWTMVEACCGRKGWDSTRAAAVGDGLNDVLLIDRCGLGVAVENARHEVLAVADAITDAHHEHGVASLINDILDGNLLLGGVRP